MITEDSIKAKKLIGLNYLVSELSVMVLNQINVVIWLLSLMNKTVLHNNHK